MICSMIELTFIFTQNDICSEKTIKTFQLMVFVKNKKQF